MNHSPVADALAVRVPVATLWTAPEAPRPVDGPAVMDDPDVPGWAAVMDQSVRKGLDGRTLTQLLLGEPVEVLEERGAWVKVLAPRQPSSLDAGYPGWMLRAHLAPVVDPATVAGTTRMVVGATTARCQVDGRELALSFGTELPVVDDTNGVATALLPGGARGQVATADLRRPGPASPRDVLEAARGFLGLRYLWGGTSAWGLDCSGLVHLVYRALGVQIARDAFDQAACVEPVGLADVRDGDLYFFAREKQRIYHVGFVSSPPDGDTEPWMLHAPESGGLIEEAPLAAHRRHHLVSAGRVRLPGAERILPSGA